MLTITQLPPAPAPRHAAGACSSMPPEMLIANSGHPSEAIRHGGASTGQHGRSRSSNGAYGGSAVARVLDEVDIAAATSRRARPSAAA
jgi:hypothetical protein